MATIGASKKGIAFVWLGIIVLIIFMGAFYVILDHSIEKSEEISRPNITGTQYEDSYNKQNVIWDYFLMMFVFGAILFGIRESMKRENQ